MTDRKLGVFSAILFDMDGTLLTSIAAVERAWTAWANRAGVSSAEVIDYLHGRRAVDAIRKFAHPAMKLDEEVKWLDDLELADLDGIEAMPGVLAFVDKLKPHQWAVVTSANGELARRRIKAAGLPLPKVLVASDDVENGKPHPEGYLQAASALRAQPERCLVFEDTETGASAGLAAGANVVLVGNGQSSLPVSAQITNFERMTVEASIAAVNITLKACP